MAIGCGPLLKGAGPRAQVVDLPPAEIEAGSAGPAPSMPELVEGQAVVVLEVPNRDARVSRVLSRRSAEVQVAGETVSGTATRAMDTETSLLCAHVPCAVPLERGSYSLAFDAGDPEPGFESRRDFLDVEVTQNMRVTHFMSRRAVEIEEPRRALPLLLEAVGIAAVVASPFIYLHGSRNSETFSQSAIGVAAGGGLIYLGVRLYEPGTIVQKHRRPRTQTQPL